MSSSIESNYWPLGPVQRAILAALDADPDGKGTVRELLRTTGREATYPAMSTYRASLATLKAYGLVELAAHWPNESGKPRLWRITDAGRTELAAQ